MTRLFLLLAALLVGVASAAAQDLPLAYSDVRLVINSGVTDIDSINEEEVEGGSFDSSVRVEFQYVYNQRINEFLGWNAGGGLVIQNDSFDNALTDGLGNRVNWDFTSVGLTFRGGLSAYVNPFLSVELSPFFSFMSTSSDSFTFGGLSYDSTSGSGTEVGIVLGGYGRFEGFVVGLEFGYLDRSMTYEWDVEGGALFDSVKFGSSGGMVGLVLGYSW